MISTRRRSITSVAPPAPEIVTNAPQPECTRMPMPQASILPPFFKSPQSGFLPGRGLSPSSITKLPTYPITKFLQHCCLVQQLAFSKTVEAEHRYVLYNVR